MSSEALKSGIRFIVETMPRSGGLILDPDAITEGLYQGVVSGRDGAVRGTLKQIDPNLFGGGGAVFLWEDVLDLGDIIDALADFNFPPDKLGLMAWKLLSTWTTLRKVRVMLTESEFRTIRAVKAGKQTPVEIANYTRLPPADVEQAIMSLRSKRYKQDLPLIEGDDQTLTTKF